MKLSKNANIALSAHMIYVLALMPGFLFSAQSPQSPPGMTLAYFVAISTICQVLKFRASSGASLPVAHARHEPRSLALVSGGCPSCGFSVLPTVVGTGYYTGYRQQSIRVSYFNFQHPVHVTNARHDSRSSALVGVPLQHRP